MRIGRGPTRLPVAWKTALAIAGAVPTSATSPEALGTERVHMRATSPLNSASSLGMSGFGRAIPADLVLGCYSVHTSDEALKAGEARITEVRPS